jgi:very-short-patch-repair endonuclease
VTLQLTEAQAAALGLTGGTPRRQPTPKPRARRGESELELAFAAQLRMSGIAGWEQEAVLVPGRLWRFDFAWIAERVAVEIDGATWANGRHNRGGGIEEDCAKVSYAAARGWRVLRFTRKMIESGVGIRLIEEALAFGKEG